MPVDREGFVVRIRRVGTGESVGVGLVVGDAHIVTCAHVVNVAIGRAKEVRDRPPEGIRVQVEFPLVGNSEGAPLRSCLLQAWDPPPAPGQAGRDVAGLVLVGGDTLPKGVGPARLVDHTGHRDVRASVFGYPGNPPGRLNGGWSSCHLRGATGGGLIQIDTGKDAALRTQAGYSGSPVVVTDEAGDAVIGLVAVASVLDEWDDVYAVPAAQLAQAWPRVLADRAVPPCPYRGLRPFTAADAERGLFVGREEEVARLRAMVRAKPLVAVVGPSGVGKSSVVAAGLRPALVEDGWTVVGCRPGTSPFDAVARALLDAERPGGAHTLDDLLSRSAQLRRDGFWQVAAQIALLTGRRIAVLADQFEEVFTARADGNTHLEFLERMLPPLDGREAAGDVRLVCTLRADFLPDLLALSGIGPRLQDRQLNISPLDVPALARVVVEPARTAGVGYADGLAEAIAREAGRGPGGLPLLEFALTRLWPHQQDRRIGFDAFHRLGGVSGALDQHAEAVLATVRESFAEPRIRRTLLAMTRARGGADSAVRVVARRERLGADWEVAEALAHADHRLVVIGPDGPGSAEIAHEALIREWTRLAAWVDEDAEFQRWLAVTEERAADADVLSETRVAEARRWLAERGADVPEEIVDLVERSQSAIAARRMTEERLDQSERRTRQLVEQARRLREESWIAGNVARISAALQGRRDLQAAASLALSEIAAAVAAPYGSFLVAREPLPTATELLGGEDGADPVLRLIAGHGHRSTEGAAAASVPEHRAEVSIRHEGRLLGRLELAAAEPFGAAERTFLEQIADVLGRSVHTIVVSTVTEGLLLESQRLTAELAVRSAELEARQEELERANEELQEKAEQLAVASRYKSEFLANMSHELRTPLNSLLILAKL
ncbi:AAA family ATPase, partial [Kitasatospora cinereorecta]|uniref:nSTAND1 domain-containing NTPase n=1 Tax=Kitasatospora cinereorecta TaxID=285560 RepID=UPI0031F925BA